MQWTAAQKQAIDLSGRDLLVSAAAGSGKTAVLSERVAERVKAGADVTSFLIITFTKAAAAQMRDKIGRKIAAALEEEPENTHLRRQMALLGKASICTIDAFCITLVQNYFHLLDLDPDLKPGGAAELDLLALNVMDEVMEQQYSAHGAAFSHLCSWLGGGKEERLAEKLLELYNVTQSFAHPMDWFHGAVEMYAQADGDIDALCWVKELKTQYRARLHGMMEQLQDLAAEAEAAGILPYAKSCRSDMQAMEQLQAALAGSWEETVRAADSCKLPRFASKPKDADPDLCAQIKKERDAIKKAYDDRQRGLCSAIAGTTPERIREGCRRVYPQLRCLEETLRLFDEQFLAAKKEQGTLSFSDFEHLALELVGREDLPVASQLREKYAEIFIDEYQDCNGVQEELFSTVARRENGVTCNLFMVGDIKQSIYKFRQADPEIFLAKDSGFGAPETKTGGAKVVLNQNFRSRKEILDYTNAVFERLMSEQLGDIRYDASHRLCPGFDYPPCENGPSGGLPELLIAQAEKDAFSLEDDDLPESAQELEIRMAVNRLMQLMQEGYQVFDSDLGGYRKLQWQDVAVLLRSPSASAHLWEKEFQRREIPFYSDTGGGYFDAQEVRLLLSLLKVVDNPLQDIPLLAVLRSGLFGFDENELLRIRAAGGGYFYHAMAKVEEPALQAKCAAVREKLSRWRDMAAALPTDAFLRRLLEETDYYAHVLALPGGEARRGNVRLIFEYAKQFESAKFRGLFHFTRFMERVKQKSDFGASKTLSENCNVVRLMSIHKSKGLEFPVVIVGQLGKRFNLRSAQEKFLTHKSLGLGCEFLDGQRKIRYDLVSHTAIRERIVQESLSEELRVLYVAFTRAREKLILTAADAKAAEKLEAWQAGKRDTVPPAAVRSASGFLAWVGLSLNAGIRAQVLSPAQIQDDFLSTTARQETALPPMPESGGWYKEIDRRLSFQYQGAPGGVLPTKFSVTELKNAYQREPDGVALVAEEMRQPEFLQDSKGLDAPQLGSLIHLVLQHVDLSLPPEEAAEEAVQRLLCRGFISEAQADAVPRGQVTRFLTSPLCRRIRQAERIWREVPFNIDVPAAKLLNKPEYGDRTVLLQGIIDCMFEENGEIVLVDYKTDSTKKSLEELTERYRVQLECYTLAARRITGKAVRERHLAFLRHGATVQV